MQVNQNSAGSHLLMLISYPMSSSLSLLYKCPFDDTKTRYDCFTIMTHTEAAYLIESLLTLCVL